MISKLQQQRRALRKRLRQIRVAISPQQRRAAQNALSRTLLRHPRLRQARHIAAYAAVGSEIDPARALARLQRRGRQIYYPRLRAARMDFIAMHSGQKRNKHGILEPQGGRRRPLWAMDAVLVPLLGFDDQGQRIGQGGGYYDRAFSQLHFRRPLLIGLAFDEQFCTHIPTAEWDQPLDSVITPQHTYNFRT